MKELRPVLFDADGVLIKNHRPFSHIHAEETGQSPADYLPFFGGDFRKALIGEVALETLIRKHEKLWQTGGDVKPLLQRWFDCENHRNEPLVKIIEREKKRRNIYMATDQEQNRARYIENVMFPGLFKAILASCYAGYQKVEPEYWEYVIGAVRYDNPGIEPEEIIYFDDGPKNIEAAKAAGIDAYVYRGNVDVEQALSLR